MDPFGDRFNRHPRQASPDCSGERAGTARWTGILLQVEKVWYSFDSLHSLFGTGTRAVANLGRVHDTHCRRRERRLYCACYFRPAAIAFTQPPPDGCMHWACSKEGSALKRSRDSEQQVEPRNSPRFPLQLPVSYRTMSPPFCSESPSGTGIPEVTTAFDRPIRAATAVDWARQASARCYRTGAA